MTIALVILAMVLLGAFTTANRALALGQESRNRTQLVAVAQEQAEALQSLYEQNGWPAFEADTINARQRSGCECFHMALVNSTWEADPGAITPNQYSAPSSSIIKITSPLGGALNPVPESERFIINYQANPTSGSGNLNDKGMLELELYNLDGVKVTP